MKESIDGQITLIKSLILERKYRDAISECDRSLEEFRDRSDEIRILRERSHSYSCVSLYREAFRDIEVVIDSEFSTVEDFFFASLNLIRAGEYGDACFFGRAGIEESIRSGDKYYLDSLYFNQAYCCAKTGAIDEAKSCLQHVEGEGRYWVDNFDWPYTKSDLEEILKKDAEL